MTFSYRAMLASRPRLIQPQNSGFDPGAQPPHLMIGVGRTAYIKLQSEENVRFFGPDPRVALLSQPNSENAHNILGVAPGRTRIEARLGNQTIEQLDISVKQERVIKTSFNVLIRKSDYEYQIREREARIEPLVHDTNKILTPQTNISLLNLGPRRVFTRKDLGNEVHAAPDNTDEVHSLARLVDSTAEINVFIVSYLTRAKWPGEVKLIDPAGIHWKFDNFIVIEDGPSYAYAGQILAHEICHFLGLGHTAPQLPNWLMCEENHGGTFIPSMFLNKLNPDKS